MKAKVVVLCQEGGHSTAIEYARLLKSSGHQVIANFPSFDEFEQSTSSLPLIDEFTTAIVLIVSEDMFPSSGLNSSIRIDAEVLQKLLQVAQDKTRLRLIPVLVSGTVEPYLKNHWLGKIQYVIDNSLEREKTLQKVDLWSGRGPIGLDISSFEDVGNIIATIEPGFVIEQIDKVSVPAQRISYEIFECCHKVRKSSTYYIHLHKRITISSTADDIRTRHPEVYKDSNKIALLGIEDGQTRLDERLVNVKEALNCQNALYLERLVADIIEEELSELNSTVDGSLNRDFLEPLVSKKISSVAPANKYEFTEIIHWLSSQRQSILVLLGQGGIGKTWTLLNLKQRISQGMIRFSKSIPRSLIFITSTDVNKGVASAHLNKRTITLYDLYISYHYAVYGKESESNILSRETFYDAIELGNLIVFIDGLDEIISRNRSRFDSDAFFRDLNTRFSRDSAGKVIISCRNIFFDMDHIVGEFPYIEVWDLLPFDVNKRDEYFSDKLAGMPSRLEYATKTSDEIARTEGGYIPFVLSLIRKMAIERADGSANNFTSIFESSILSLSHNFDRIIGQFCNREIDKAADPTIELSVDQQIKVFGQIARLQESGRGKMNTKGVETSLSEILRRRDVNAIATHLATHPFISQDILEKTGNFEFCFDFMPEYFLMLDAHLRMEDAEKFTSDDIKIFNKYCSATSSFAHELVNRWNGQAYEFRIRLISMLEDATKLISESFPNEDFDILSPESQIAQFSFSIVSLLAIQSWAIEGGDYQSFTDSLSEIFEENGIVKSMAILDGFVRGEERMKIDFRGRAFEGCLFHSLDFWSCSFDETSTFRNCRFMKCTGNVSLNSGVQKAVFENCLYDADFEKNLQIGHNKVQSSEFKKHQSVKSLISDFYRAGGFRSIDRSNLQRYYGQSNSSVPFKKLFDCMKKHGLLFETNKGHYTQISISAKHRQGCERLLTQGDPSQIIQKICNEL